MNQDLRIVSLTKVELQNALKTNTYWSPASAYVPFSKSKAAWLLQNERIANDDVCAVLGLENDELVSFVYLIPDLLQTTTGVTKVYWSRRWWIHPKYKDTVLPTFTMNTALEAANHKIIIKFLGRDVEAYYKKQPFKEVAERTRYFIVFNLDAHLLSSKIHFLKYFYWGLKRLDRASLKLSAFINTRKVKSQTKDLNYNYLAVIDSKTWAFIKPFCANDCIPKDSAYINWQIDNNQYTHTLVEHKHKNTCLVAGAANRIYNTSFTVIKNDEIIGFISFLVRRQEAVIRYFICDDAHLEYCANALLENIIATNATNIQTENDVLGQLLQQKFFNIHTNKRTLYGLVNHSIAIEDELSFLDRDGNFS
jgi:hypothetical protein